MAEFENIKPGDPEFEAEIRRRALKRIQELEKKGYRGKKAKAKEKAPAWGPLPELWPGGPSTDTGDIAIVSRNARKSTRRRNG